jgi:hypothetical protein
LLPSKFTFHLICTKSSKPGVALTLEAATFSGLRVAVGWWLPRGTGQGQEGRNVADTQGRRDGDEGWVAREEGWVAGLEKGPPAGCEGCEWHQRTSGNGLGRDTVGH